jgi:hypothetical protein
VSCACSQVLIQFRALAGNAFSLEVASDVTGAQLRTMIAVRSRTSPLLRLRCAVLAGLCRHRVGHDVAAARPTPSLLANSDW